MYILLSLLSSLKSTATVSICSCNCYPELYIVNLFNREYTHIVYHPTWLKILLYDYKPIYCFSSSSGIENLGTDFYSFYPELYTNCVCFFLFIIKLIVPGLQTKLLLIKAIRNQKQYTFLLLLSWALCTHTYMRVLWHSYFYEKNACSTLFSQWPQTNSFCQQYTQCAFCISRAFYIRSLIYLQRAQIFLVPTKKTFSLTSI